jgi:hypothetical protein
MWLNNASIANGPTAQRGTYVGTTRSDASSQLNWVVPGNGIAGNYAVFNTYNRVMVAGTASESATSWTYSSSTIRPSNGGTAARISFMMGLAEDGIYSSALQALNVPATSGAFGRFGLAMDITNNFDRFADPSQLTPAGLSIAGLNVPDMYPPQLGYHFITQVEAGDGTNTVTFVGGLRMGLTVQTRM